VRKLSVAALVVGLVLLLAVPALAGGPANMATGSGYWTNGQGLDFYAEFNAHEAMDNRSAKGYLLQVLVDGTGGFTVNVDSVQVYETYACFGGTTDSAWGTYASRAGQYRWTMVKDGGEPSVADYLRGSWEVSKPAYCSGGNPGTNEAWSGGNVQMHYFAP
jgi:hypothetical protein